MWHETRDMTRGGGVMEFRDSFSLCLTATPFYCKSGRKRQGRPHRHGRRKKSRAETGEAKGPSRKPMAAWQQRCPSCHAP